MARRTIDLNNEKVEAELVEFEADREPWSNYILHDGSQIKLKPVLAEVLRVIDRYAPNGDPLYVIQVQPVISIIAPPALRLKV